MKIQVLKDEVVNKIAAGEVVERPVSIVRELLDNSIDSQASHISIQIEDGGKRQISIKDNGCGMSHDDALLAFERHATSKLARLEELQSIATLGFRGEALSSIAAVAKVELRSKENRSEIGTQVVIHGGRLLDVSPCVCATGTEISVKNLFYNTPARRKFLKMAATESRLIKRWVQNFSLAYPQVHFEVQSEGKSLLQLPALGSRLERAQRIFTGEYLPCEHNFQNYRVEGLIGHPSIALHSGQGFLFLVNGRLVSDRLLMRAVRDGYDSMLRSHEYPQGFISLELPYPELDVNVHPQKSEVRFLSSKLIYTLIRDAVRDCVQSFRRPLAGLSDSVSAQISSGFQPLREPDASKPFRGGAGGQFTLEFNRNSAGLTLPEVFPETRGTLEDKGLPNLSSSVTVEPVSAEFQYRNLKYLGQLFDCFLLFELKEQFYVIDMHAAHERINFNLIRTRLMQNSLQNQALLIPMRIDLDVCEAERLLQQASLLEKFGFDIENFGEGSLLVRSAPALLPQNKILATIKDLLQFLPEDPELEPALIETGLLEMLDHLCARIACHASIRSGKKMEEEEVYALLEQMDSNELSSACPHGRPVVIHYSRDQIESWFGRDK